MSNMPKKKSSIENRIIASLDDLTASEKKLAETVLELQATLATFTAVEIAARAGTSQATAVRFFRRLGYDSFADMKREAREFSDWGSPLYQISGTGQARMEGGDLALHMAQDLKNITQTAEAIPKEMLEDAVASLIKARRIYIVGYRNSAAIAAYARNLLALLRDDVALLPTQGLSSAESLIGIGEGDILLAIGFRRRPRVLLATLEVAKKLGATAILITDPTATTSARLADVTLRCMTASAGIFDSYAAAMSLINHLCTRIADLGGEETVARLARFEELHNDIDGVGGGLAR